VQPVEFFAMRLTITRPNLFSKPVIAIGREHLDLVIDNAR